MDPVDSTTYQHINALVSYVENPTLDSLIKLVQTDTQDKKQIFTRALQDIKKPEIVKGYISQQVVQQNIENIEKDVRRLKPEHSIIVPESEFVGIYSSLPLILGGNLEQMLNDSLVSLPPHLLESAYEPRQLRNHEFREKLDSMRTHYLDSTRIAYNNKLIEAFRDSVSRAYREKVIRNYTDSVVNNYISAVTRSNQRILGAYNEVKTMELNDEALQSLEEIIKYAHTIPHEITIINAKNESALLRLSNDEPWFTWFYLKNMRNDSIGIRVEGMNRQAIKMLVDESVSFNRLTQRERKDVSQLVPQRSLPQKLTKLIIPKPIELPWCYGGRTYSGFTETYINDYWAKGGESSASILATFNYFVNYSKGKIKWENSLDTKLGFMYYFKKDESKPDASSFHKNSDNFDLSSRLGVSAFKNWYYSTELVFKTQLLEGRRNRYDTDIISAFLSPANLTFSIGLDYKPNKDFSLFLSPVSLRTTIVTHPKVSRTRYGLAEGENIKSRIGSYLKLEHNRKISNDISIRTKNNLFVNFGKNEVDEPLWRKFPDIDSETTLNFKVNQFVTTQVNLHMIYDKDVKSEWQDKDGVLQKGPRLQLKQFLTLGFTYRF